MPILVLPAIARRDACEVLHIDIGTNENIPKKAGLSLEWATKIATLAFVLLFLAGCNRIARSWYLSGYDRDISSATKAIESARDNAHLAEACAKRGSAYSEKARYSRAFKLISADEYDRLFGLALKDHSQIVSAERVPASRGDQVFPRLPVKRSLPFWIHPKGP